MLSEDIVKRCDQRPGYRVADYGEVGLPLYEVVFTALCAQRGAPGAIQEFCLRLAAQGVREPADIAGILGVSDDVCLAALAELLRTDEIRLVRELHCPGQVELTARGRETIESGWAERPTEQTFQMRFDGWLRRIVYVPSGSICDSRQAKIRGLTTLRSFPAGLQPSLDELRPAEANEALEKLLGTKARSRRILRVTRIQKIKRMHLPALGIAYKNVADDSIQVGFAIDGRESEQHAVVFAHNEGVKRVREFSELLKPALKVEVADAVAVDEPPVLKVPAPAAPPVRLPSHAPQTSVVPVYEHPRLLREAVEGAERLLVVIAPWIRRAVVNAEFLDRLETTLQRGTRVYLGYGIGENDRDAQDEDAVEGLRALAGRFDRLVLKRLGDTHAKVLIKDEEFYVITSFNWLSFRGDPERRFREERGSLVKVPEAVRDFWSMIEPRFRGKDEHPVRSGVR